MNMHAQESSDAYSNDIDGFSDADGPLFYTLSQSMQDELTAHYVSLAMAAEQGSAMQDRLAA